MQNCKTKICTALTCLLILSTCMVSYGQALNKLIVFNFSVVDKVPAMKDAMVISDSVFAEALFHHEKPQLYLVKSRGKDSCTVFTSDLSDKSVSKFISTSTAVSHLQFTPDKKSISCLISLGMNGNALIQYALLDKKQSFLTEHIHWESYVWIDDNSLLATVAGDPNTLTLQTLRPKREMPIAKNVSESMHRIYNLPSVYFIHKLSVDYWSIKKVKPDDGRIITVTQTLQDEETFALTPQGYLLMSTGNKLFYYDEKRNSGWKELAIATTISFSGIVKIAVNANGDKIALVVTP